MQEIHGTQSIFTISAESQCGVPTYHSSSSLFSVNEITGSVHPIELLQPGLYTFSVFADIDGM